jgi:hypothetical protein
MALCTEIVHHRFDYDNYVQLVMSGGPFQGAEFGCFDLDQRHPATGGECMSAQDPSKEHHG